MGKALFILIVILLVFGFVMIRFRRQIAGVIGIAKALKETQQAATQATSQLRNNASEKSIPLVNCSKCGVWVPQAKARKMGELFFCSDACIRAEKHA